MKKHAKLLILIALTAVLCITLASCGKTEPRESDEYYAYTFSDVRMIQKGINGYDFSFDVDTVEENVKVYLTERDHIRESDVPIEATRTVAGEKTHFAFSASVQLSQGYFLWVKGEKEAVLPITAPSMFPSISIVSGVPQYDFSFTPGVSWSCFCDPAGRAIYVSDKDSFDDSATCIMSKGAITEQTFILNNYDESKYYYSVVTAKNGLLTIVSSPVMSSENIVSQISSVSASIAIDGGKPILHVNATLNDGEIASSRAQYLELLVKNDTGDEIYSCASVFDESDNSVEMTFDCSLLLIEGKWYDLAFAYKGTLALNIPDLFDGNAVGSSGTVKIGEYVYSLPVWGDGHALKVTFERHVDMSDMFDAKYVRAAEIVEENGAPILKVTVKLSGSYPDLDLVITGGSEVVLFTAEREDMADGTTVYKVNLSGLSEAGKWYDVKFAINGEQAGLYYLDYMSAQELAQKKTIGTRTYGFQTWEAELKVEFTEA